MEQSSLINNQEESMDDGSQSAAAGIDPGQQIASAQQQTRPPILAPPADPTQTQQIVHQSQPPQQQIQPQQHQQQAVCPPDCTIWMGDLSVDWDAQFIREAFGQHNQNITNVKMVTTEHGTKKATYCFVEFRDEESARVAILDVNGKPFPNDPMGRARFNLAFANSPYHMSIEYNLFVNNLAQDVDDVILFRLFGERYRSCRGAKVYRHEDGSSKEQGFVRFTSETDQQRALVEMNKQHFHGRELYLKLARPKTRGTGPGGGGGRYGGGGGYRGGGVGGSMFGSSGGGGYQQPGGYYVEGMPPPQGMVFPMSNPYPYYHHQPIPGGEGGGGGPSQPSPFQYRQYHQHESEAQAHQQYLQTIHDHDETHHQQYHHQQQQQMMMPGNLTNVGQMVQQQPAMMAGLMGAMPGAAYAMTPGGGIMALPVGAVAGATPYGTPMAPNHGMAGFGGGGGAAAMMAQAQGFGQQFLVAAGGYQQAGGLTTYMQPQMLHPGQMMGGAPMVPFAGAQIAAAGPMPHFNQQKRPAEMAVPPQPVFEDVEPMSAAEHNALMLNTSAEFHTALEASRWGPVAFGTDTRKKELFHVLHS